MLFTLALLVALSAAAVSATEDACAVSQRHARVICGLPGMEARCLQAKDAHEARCGVTNLGDAAASTTTDCYKLLAGNEVQVVNDPSYDKWAYKTCGSTCPQLTSDNGSTEEFTGHVSLSSTCAGCPEGMLPVMAGVEGNDEAVFHASTDFTLSTKAKVTCVPVKKRDLDTDLVCYPEVFTHGNETTVSCTRLSAMAVPFSLSEFSGYTLGTWTGWCRVYKSASCRMAGGKWRCASQKVVKLYAVADGDGWARQSSTTIDFDPSTVNDPPMYCSSDPRFDEFKRKVAKGFPGNFEVSDPVNGYSAESVMTLQEAAAQCLETTACKSVSCSLSCSLNSQPIDSKEYVGKQDYLNNATNSELTWKMETHVLYENSGQGSFDAWEGYTNGGEVTGHEGNTYSYIEAKTKCNEESACTSFTCAKHDVCTMRTGDSADLVYERETNEQPHFYNTYVPGGFCGDNADGEVTRLDEHGQWFKVGNFPSIVAQFHEKNPICEYVTLSE